MGEGTTYTHDDAFNQREKSQVLWSIYRVLPNIPTYFAGDVDQWNTKIVESGNELTYDGLEQRHEFLRCRIVVQEVQYHCIKALSAACRQWVEVRSDERLKKR